MSIKLGYLEGSLMVASLNLRAGLVAAKIVAPRVKEKFPDIQKGSGK